MKKLQVVNGNKKLTKKELIYRSLEYSYERKLNLKEAPEKEILRKDLDRVENNIIEKITFIAKDISMKIDLLKKHLN